MEIAYTIFFVVSGASLIFTLFVCIKWNVFSLIGELSGKTAKRSIQRTRSINEKKYKDSKNDSQSPKINMNVSTTYVETGILENNKSIIGADEGTVLLSSTGEKKRIKDFETTVLNSNSVQVKKRKKSTVKLKMIDQVIFINTNEYI